MSMAIEGKSLVLQGERRGLKNLRLPLLAGFLCPKCGGILKAYFEVKEPVPVWKYEGVEDEHHTRLHTFSVPGGQGIVSNRHDGRYDPVCGLKVYWALNLKENLLKWFEENFSEYRLTDLANLVRKVEAGEVEGLTAVRDLFGSTDRLLTYDSSEWEVRWKTNDEQWEEYRKRRDTFLQNKLRTFGCVVAETK